MKVVDGNYRSEVKEGPKLIEQRTNRFGGRLVGTKIDVANGGTPFTVPRKKSADDACANHSDIES